MSNNVNHKIPIKLYKTKNDHIWFEEPFERVVRRAMRDEFEVNTEPNKDKTRSKPVKTSLTSG